jgi:hypothetical protein
MSLSPSELAELLAFEEKCIEAALHVAPFEIIHWLGQFGPLTAA